MLEANGKGNPQRAIERAVFEATREFVMTGMLERPPKQPKGEKGNQGKDNKGSPSQPPEDKGKGPPDFDFATFLTKDVKWQNFETKV